MSDTLGRTLPGIATRLDAIAASVGAAQLRETRHLDPNTISALRESLPGRTVARARRVSVPSWPSVGNVDVVVEPGTPHEPMLGIELKWCYHDKLYEAIWDLFKMALLATSGVSTYLLTGADQNVWSSSIGKELFDNGLHAPAKVCELRLPWGRRRLAWDDLLEGGYDGFPEEVPTTIRTTVVGRQRLASDNAAWELRAVRVEPIGPEMTSFREGWPFPRPPDALRPLAHS